MKVEISEDQTTIQTDIRMPVIGWEGSRENSSLALIFSRDSVSREMWLKSSLRACDHERQSPSRSVPKQTADPVHRSASVCGLILEPLFCQGTAQGHERMTQGHEYQPKGSVPQVQTAMGRAAGLRGEILGDWLQGNQ